MVHESKIRELIASIYEAAVEPSAWPGVLLRIGDAVGRASILLITTENFERPVEVWLARYDPGCVETRLRHYARPDVNPIVRAAMEIGPLCVLPRQQFITDRGFEQDAAARSTLISQGLFHGCIATLYRDGPLLSTLEVYRARGLGKFNSSELGTLRPLVPHLANALRVNRCVSASQIHQHQAEEALHRLNVGLLLLGTDGRIIFGNRAAEQLLHQRDGIRSRNGRLTATDHHDNTKLAGILTRPVGQAVPAGRVQALPISRGAGRRPLQAWTVPLPHQSSSFQTSPPQIMMVVVDPEHTTAPPLAALKALYGMTEAEARLTCGLLEGARLEDYAERAGISMNTARTHLKSIFAKTETTRQADLVHLLNILRPD